jgi:hypothetical protein
MIVLVVFILSLIGSNLILKNEYSQIDRTDPFWNYAKLAKGSFHHIKMTGGNITRTSFIPGPRGSFGILNYTNVMKDRVQASISHDTLYVLVKPHDDPPGWRNWMQNHVLMAFSCPELISVNGMNANMDLYKLKQRNLSVHLSGKSTMEVESYNADFDSIFVNQADTSQLKFEMAEDIRGSGTMRARILDASVQGYSLLDVGHFQLKNIHQSVGDSSGIILSGATLKTMGYER